MYISECIAIFLIMEPQIFSTSHFLWNYLMSWDQKKSETITLNLFHSGNSSLKLVKLHFQSLTSSPKEVKSLFLILSAKLQLNMHPVISSELIFLDYNILVFIFSSKKKNKPTLKEPLFSLIFSILGGGILLQWLIKMHTSPGYSGFLIILSLVITCPVNSLSVSLENHHYFHRVRFSYRSQSFFHFLEKISSSPCSISLWSNPCFVIRENQAKYPVLIKSL